MVAFRVVVVVVVEEEKPSRSSRIEPNASAANPFTERTEGFLFFRFLLPSSLLFSLFLLRSVLFVCGNILMVGDALSLVGSSIAMLFRGSPTKRALSTGQRYVLVLSCVEWCSCLRPRFAHRISVPFILSLDVRCPVRICYCLAFVS